MTNTILTNKIIYGEVKTPDKHLTSFVESRQITKVHPEIISNYQTLISVINHPNSLFCHSRSISLSPPSDLSYDNYPEYQKNYAKDYRKEERLSSLNSSDNDFWEPI